MGTVLGVDYGSKRIGLARGSSEAKLASPLTTLANNSQFWTLLRTIIAAEGVEKLVLGLPRGLDGQETAQTAQVRAFGKELQAKTGLPLLWQDEAATSQVAVQQGSTDVDSAAAAIFLQDYLDSL